MQMAIIQNDGENISTNDNVEINNHLHIWFKISLLSYTRQKNKFSYGCLRI